MHLRKTVLSLALTVSLLASSLAVTAGASSTKPANLVLLGDSIATGYGLASTSDRYGDLLAKAFGLTSGSTYKNLAVDGATSGDLLKALQNDTNGTMTAVKSADTVVISIGGNDILAPFLASVKTALGLSDSATFAQLKAAADANPDKVDAAATNFFGDGTEDDTPYMDAFSTFMDNFVALIGAVHSANSDAKIYVQTIYDPFSGLVDLSSDSDQTDPYADSFGSAEIAIYSELALSGINGTIEGFAQNASDFNLTDSDDSGNVGMAGRTVSSTAALKKHLANATRVKLGGDSALLPFTAVDIYSAFYGKSATLTNIANLDVHPNKAGHEVIFETLYKAITGTDYVASSSSKTSSTKPASSVKAASSAKAAVTATAGASSAATSTAVTGNPNTADGSPLASAAVVCLLGLVGAAAAVGLKKRME